MAGRRRKLPERSADPAPPAAGIPAPGRSGLWIVLGAALLVRAVYYVEYLLSPLRGFYGADDVYYLAWAGRIAQGDWLGSEVFEQGPLYPYLVGTMFALVGPRVYLLLLLQLLSGVVVVWLTYAAALRLMDRTTAVTAGLLAAVYGPLVFYECMPMKSFLSPLTTSIALYAGVRYGQSLRLPWLALAGVAVGAACLIQEFHVLLLVPLALSVWIAQPAGSAPSRRWLPLAVLAAGCLVCIFPVTLRNRVVAGEWVLVTAGGGEVFYIAQGPQARGFYNPPDFVLAATGQEHEDFRQEARRRTGKELTRGESSRYWFREGLRTIAADPWRTIQLTAAKAAILLGDYDVPDSQSYVATRAFVPALRILPSFGWIAGLGLLGIALASAAWRKYILPLGFIAAHAAPILVFYNFGRFRIGMMPVWILLSAWAGVWIVRKLRSSEPADRPRGAAGLLAAVLLSAASFYPLLREDFRLSDAKFVATLAMRGEDYPLAQQKLAEILSVLDTLPVEQSQSVQYLAQVAEIRTMQADVSLRLGNWSEALEQVRTLRRLPPRAEHPQERLKAAETLLARAMEDARLAADPASAEALRQELADVRAALANSAPQ